MKKLSWASLCVALTLSQAWAEGAEPPPARSVGRPHTCTSYYPPDMQAQSKEGEILLAFTVRKNGRVDNLRVDQSSGVPELDAAAIICASHWLYKPATKAGGRPVDTPWKAKVIFRLPPHEPSASPPTP